MFFEAEYNAYSLKYIIRLLQFKLMAFQLQYKNSLGIALRIKELKYFNYPKQINQVCIAIRRISDTAENNQEQTQVFTLHRRKDKAKWNQDFYMNNISGEQKLQLSLYGDQNLLAAQTISIRDCCQEQDVPLNHQVQFTKQNIKIATLQLQMSSYLMEDSMAGILDPSLSLKQMKVPQKMININKIQTVQTSVLNCFSFCDHMQSNQGIEIWPSTFASKNQVA